MAATGNRKFKSKDGDMLSKIASSMHYFKKHIAEFTVFDPELNATYYDNWKQALETLTQYYNMDKFELLEASDLLAEATESLADCHAKYREVKYFAGLAFAGNREVMREFGEGSYSKVRHSHLKMVQFMETLHGVATKYKAELIAKNYTQAAIDEIATLTNTLRSDNQQQQLKKKERPSETRKRVDALNAFYAFGQRVSEAARKIYFKDDIVRNQFKLALRHHPKVSGMWVNIGAGGVRKIALLKLLKKYRVTLTNQAKEDLAYWRADTINETPVQKLPLKAGETMAIEPEVPAKKFILVQNTTSKPVRIKLKKELKAKR